MNYKYFLNIILLFFNLAVTSQIIFESNVSKKSLGINERLRVEFTLNEDGDNFKPPSFKNFKVVCKAKQQTTACFKKFVATSLL